MSDELKPVKCGCGGKAQIIFPFMHTDVYLIECNECGICTSSYNTEAEAVQAWNRAMGERTAKVERTSVKNTYICSNCGRPMHPVDFSMPNKYCGFCGAKLDWSGNDEKA